jgi:putative SOS response-associated peptidase YedK
VCGRFAQFTPLPKAALRFEAVLKAELPPRYNVSPQSDAAVVRLDPRKVIRKIETLTWGLMPSWMVGRKDAHPLINARAETLAEKPSFKEAFAQRRCLIPVDGFYEWKREGGAKVPHYFSMRDGGMFALAGLWDSHEKDRKRVDTFTIVTTGANALMAPVHDRMPVIIGRDDIPVWLDPGLSDFEVLKRFLRPSEGEGLQAVPVSAYVSHSKNEGPDCIKAV